MADCHGTAHRGAAYWRQYSDILPAAPVGEAASEWWVPLLDGTERMGLLRVTAERDDVAARDIEALAGLIALIVVSKRGTSDTLAKLVRAQPMSITAEMQWNLLPPRTYADGRVVIYASLEPAYQISGDVFEYAIEGPLVHLSIFDAMGHGTAAGLSCGLAMGACRKARSEGVDLVGKAKLWKPPSSSSTATGASSPAFWPPSTPAPASCNASTGATIRRS
ncbi:hypothetical protein [Streptomyces sp. NPDC058145]|uniref:hypothetical protein n=1 Tax=Streptomyces sp. NPDC058145 TaxID=3346356 RepID=UPI0036F0799C